jgi:hypothetical protein
VEGGHKPGGHRWHFKIVPEVEHGALEEGHEGDEGKVREAKGVAEKVEVEAAEVDGEELCGGWGIAEGGRSKEEGGRRKEEGERSMEEGGRRKEHGGRRKEKGAWRKEEGAWRKEEGGRRKEADERGK